MYGERDKNLCLMDMACIGAEYLKKHGKADDLDESEEINACSIKVKAKIDGREEDWLVMFKTKPITIRRKSNPSAARPPVWAAPSATRSQARSLRVPEPCV